MKFGQEQIAKTKELIGNARRIAILPSKISGVDAFCAGVGLYHMIKELDDKEVLFIYAGKIPDGCDNLISNEDIESNISHRELVVDIDYSSTPAEKVSYTTKGDVLTLKVFPVQKDYDLSKVKTYFRGIEFDLAIMVGVLDPMDLGQVYKELEMELLSTKIINLDNTDMNRRYGSVNIINPEAWNLNLLVFSVASELELSPNKKAAQAILTGLLQDKVAK